MTTGPLTVRDPGVADVITWFQDHGRPLPWRPSRDVYAIWVSEVMSAQTSVERAARAWERWMTRWPTVDALAGASLAEVLAQWQGLGYPRRARDLHRAARIVATDGWPDVLTDLPGIGEYVSSAIRCFALEEPVLPRDVNVRRVLARRFPEGIDPAGDPWRTGQALMEFGQRICRARPQCAECPVAVGCPAREADPARPFADPAPRARRQAPYAGSLRERRGRLLRRVLDDGPAVLDELDAEEVRAAATLAEDGLVRIVDGLVGPPD